MLVDLGIVGSLIGGGSALAGLVTGWYWRRRSESKAEHLEARQARTEERTVEQAAQSAAIAERDALIKTITETLIDPLRKEVAELREWKVRAERRIDEAEERNDRLVAFIYKLIGIIHRAGVDHEILPADIPPGIHL